VANTSALFCAFSCKVIYGSECTKFKFFTTGNEKSENLATSSTSQSSKKKLKAAEQGSFRHIITNVLNSNELTINVNWAGKVNVFYVKNKKTWA
jgi:hypothetical protein